MMPLRSNLTQKCTAPVSLVMSFPSKQVRVILRNFWLLSAPVVLVLALWPFISQSHPSAETSKGIQMLLRRTVGASPLHKDRLEPSSLRVVDGRPYLIGCDIATMRATLRSDIRPETIGTIFITQHPPGHDLSLADVMANGFFNLDLADAAQHEHPWAATNRRTPQSRVSLH
jgi:hypothetical protein